MQFFFTRTEKNPTSEEINIFKDSFNINNIILTHENEDGSRIVVLNDGHPESRYDHYPVVKNSKVVGQEYRKEAAYYQSQITLNKEDSERFVNQFPTEPISINN